MWWGWPTYKVQYRLWFIFSVQDQVYWQSCSYEVGGGLWWPTYKVRDRLWFIFPVHKDQVYRQSCSYVIDGVCWPIYKVKDRLWFMMWEYDDLPKKSKIDFGLFSQYTKIRYTGSPVAMMIHPIPVTYGKHVSHDMIKPTRWVCAQRWLRSAWASTQSDQCLRCPHEESLGT